MPVKAFRDGDRKFSNDSPAVHRDVYILFSHIHTHITHTDSWSPRTTTTFNLYASSVNRWKSSACQARSTLIPPPAFISSYLDRVTLYVHNFVGRVTDLDKFFKAPLSLSRFSLWEKREIGRGRKREKRRLVVRERVYVSHRVRRRRRGGGGGNRRPGGTFVTRTGPPRISLSLYYTHASRVSLSLSLSVVLNFRCGYVYRYIVEGFRETSKCV